MKTLLSALFLLFGISLLIIDSMLIDQNAFRFGLGWAITLVSAVMFIRSLFSPREKRMTLAEMEEAGLIEEKDFKAKRAFQIEECEDEGLHYMIELEDRSMLKLTGQIYYDLDPIYDNNIPRRFPCTEFTLRRNTKTGAVVGVICRGEPLEPECLAPSFDRDDDEDFIWAPFVMIRNRTYDDIKAERMSRGRADD